MENVCTLILGGITSPQISIRGLVLLSYGRHSSILIGIPLGGLVYLILGGTCIVPKSHIEGSLEDLCP